MMDLSDLETFTVAYVDCALFTSSIEDEVGASLEMPGDTSMESAGFTSTDLAYSGGWSEIHEACESFVRTNLADLADLEPVQAGHDFWLTRNRHGAGFWDRGLGEVGTRLTDAAHPYGESLFYVGDDGRIYVA